MATGTVGGCRATIATVDEFLILWFRKVDEIFSNFREFGVRCVLLLIQTTGLMQSKTGGCVMIGKHGNGARIAVSYCCISVTWSLRGTLSRPRKK